MTAAGEGASRSVSAIELASLLDPETRGVMHTLQARSRYASRTPPESAVQEERSADESRVELGGSPVGPMAAAARSSQ
jgi:hypothetical protein